MLLLLMAFEFEDVSSCKVVNGISHFSLEVGIVFFSCTVTGVEYCLACQENVCNLVQNFWVLRFSGSVVVEVETSNYPGRIRTKFIVECFQDIYDPAVRAAAYQDMFIPPFLDREVLFMGEGGVDDIRFSLLLEQALVPSGGDKAGASTLLNRNIPSATGGVSAEVKMSRLFLSRFWSTPI